MLSVFQCLSASERFNYDALLVVCAASADVMVTVSSMASANTSILMHLLLDREGYGGDEPDFITVSEESDWVLYGLLRFVFASTAMKDVRERLEASNQRARVDPNLIEYTLSLITTYRADLYNTPVREKIMMLDGCIQLLTCTQNTLYTTAWMRLKRVRSHMWKLLLLYNHHLYPSSIGPSHVIEDKLLAYIENIPLCISYCTVPYLHLCYN